MAQVLVLPSKIKTLSSNPSTAKNKAIVFNFFNLKLNTTIFIAKNKYGSYTYVSCYLSFS
jgi:hypothetical protein